MRLLQQIHIVDDGGQGGLNVVGNVGYQLRLHPVGLELILRRHHGHIRQGVELFGAVRKAADQIFRGNPTIQIALRHPPGPRQDHAEGIGTVGSHSAADDQRKDEQNQPAVRIIAECHRQPQQEYHRAQNQRRDHPLPHGVQRGEQPHRHTEQPPAAFGQRPHTPAEKAVAPPVAAGCLALGRQSEEVPHRQQRRAKEGQYTQHHQTPLEAAGIRIGCPACQHTARRDQQAHASHRRDGVKIQRQTVQPAGPDFLAVPLMTGSDDQIHHGNGEHRQADQQAGQQIRLAALQQRHQLPVALGIAGAEFLGQIDPHQILRTFLPAQIIVAISAHLLIIPGIAVIVADLHRNRGFRRGSGALRNPFGHRCRHGGILRLVLFRRWGDKEQLRVCHGHHVFVQGESLPGFLLAAAGFQNAGGIGKGIIPAVHTQQIIEFIPVIIITMIVKGAVLQHFLCGF